MKSDSPSSSSQRLLSIYSLLRPYGWEVIAVIVFVLLSSATLLSFPYLAGKMIDLALGKQVGYSSIAEVLVHMLVLVGLQIVFSYMRMYFSGKLSDRAAIDLKQHSYDHLIRLPMRFYDTHRVGDLLSRLNTDISLIQQGLSTSLAESIRQVAIIVVGIGLIFSIAPSLSLLLVAVMPVFLMLGWYFGKKLRRLSKQRQAQQGQSHITAEESLHLISTIKSFTAEALQAKRYAQEQSHFLKMSLRSTKQRSFFVSLLLGVMLASTALLLYYGALLVEVGEMRTGNLLSFVLYTTFIGGSVASLGDLYGQLQKIKGAGDRIEELFLESPESNYLKQGQLAFVDGDIRVSHLDFRYPTRPEVEVLHDLSIRIDQGSRVALVGPSGSGKSTLASLLLRYYPTKEGCIQIGKHDISDFSIQSLRNQIGFVAQEPILFGGSIAENIQYGRPDASREELIQAAEQAYVMEFASRLPKGLETGIGDRGLKLSGGQRQRVAIARVILKNPPILILDEATSALDTASEQWIQRALEQLLAHRTTLIIAHRLSTIRNADRIYVLKEGELVETGSHEELLQNTQGVYKKLVELQNFT